MVQHLLELMPPHTLYCEVFGGAAHLLFAKPPAPAVEVYNDVDARLVNFFRVLQDEEKSKELHRRLQWTLYSRSEYYRALEMLKRDDVTDISGAWAFFVAVRQSFGGKLGGSWGHGRTERYGSVAAFHNTVDVLMQIRERLRGVQVEHDDFRNIIPRYDTTETLFYCDPPYLQETRAGGVEYQHEMSRQDHIDLLELLNSVQGMVMLSGYDSPLYREYLDDRGWTRYEFQKPLQVAGRVRGSSLVGEGAVKRAGYRTEVVWLNRSAVKARSELVLVDAVS